MFAAPAPAGATTVPDQWTGTYGTAGNSSTNAGEHVLTLSTAAKAKTAWTAANRIIGPYPPVVLGGVTYTVGFGKPATFVASSPRTGAVLWRITLPYPSSDFLYGMTGTGSTVLISYNTYSTDVAGVLAVSTTKRAVLWRAALPKSTSTDFSSDYPGPPSTDGTRVYLQGSSNGVNAYSLTSCALQWKVPYTRSVTGTINGVDGIAAGGGYVYTSGGQGVVAYSAATGKKVWGTYPAISYGPPVLAGGRVIVSDGRAVEAFPASGCGRSTCSATWATPVASYDYTGATVAAADGTSVFLTYRTERAGGPAACGGVFVGNVARLSASTGKLQWHVILGDYNQNLIRGGNAIWLLDEYWNSRCLQAYRILGYSATATGPAPTASIILPGTYYGFPQSLAIASGTLFETFRYTLVGYRALGT